MRLLEDALCDEEAVEFIVETATKQLCSIMPDQDECTQLAEALLPVAVEWLRASATPASLCASVGVCGSGMLGDAFWDKPAARLSDGLECPMCKHVVAAVERDAAAAAAAAAAAVTVTAAGVRSSVRSACGQLPGDMAAACAKEMDKRGALLLAVVGAAANRDTTEACELVGMCVGRLARFRAPPLGAVLVRQLAAARTALAAAQSRLGAEPKQPSVSDNRCDMCKLTVLEVATLLANPGFQDSVLGYAETVCNSTVPAVYAATCKDYVDSHVPRLFELLQAYVQPGEVCVRLHMCPKPSMWQGIVTGLRARGGVLGKVLGAAAQ